MLAVACVGIAMLAYGWQVRTNWAPSNHWMIIPPALAAAAAIYGSRRRQHDDHIAWVLVGSSCAITAASIALGSWQSALGLHDVTQLVSILRAPDRALLAMALVAMIVDRAHVHDRNLALESTIIGLASASAVWVSIIEPALARSPLDSSGRMLSLALPASDLLLITFGARMLLGSRVRSRSFVALQLAILGRVVADLANYRAEVGGRATSIVVDVIAALSFALFVWAALDRHPGRPARVAHHAVRLGRIRLMSIVLCAIAPQIVLISLLLDDNAKHSTIVFAAGIAAVVSMLALTRLWGLAISVRHLTERRGNDRLASLVERSSDVVVLVDACGEISYASPALRSVLGFETEDWVGQRIESIDAHASGEPRASLWADVMQLAPETALTHEVSALHANGERRTMELSAVNLTTNVAVAGIVLTLRDVTAHRSMERQLSLRTEHDPMTGLANRVTFMNALVEELQGGRLPTVMFIDVDDFRVINDGLGHAAGDELLRSVAERLSARFDDVAMLVARIGSDEFGVLLPDIPTGVADDLARQAIADLKKSMKVNDFQSVSASACIGVAAAEATNTATDVMRNAGMALDRAKQLGKGQVEGFDADLGRKSERRNEYKRDLLDALGRDQFHLVYQPIVCLSDGRTVGAEALLRWDHHVYGNVLPGDFVPLAEQAGVMIPIGDWVLEQACTSAMGWADDSMFVTVNVSGIELRETDFIDTARRCLKVSGLPATRLVLDVTEAALLEEGDDACTRLDQLRNAGIRTALDDFGTGYSSLAYVQRLPLDIIKIDHHIVQSIEDPRSNALAHTIITMAANLGMRTLAEGVETEAQALALAKLGCELAQGYLFFKPLSPVAMTALVEFERQPAEANAANGSAPGAGHAAAKQLPPPAATALAEVPPLPIPPAEDARDCAAGPPAPAPQQEFSHLLRPLLG